jgi:uncharacterized protein (TIGR00730 family)
MDEPHFFVAVYCASSEAVDRAYRRMAADLGGAIASEGWGIVYGGGNVGLMGEVARGALAAGGYVKGVIPHRLVERELALDDVTELVVVDTMRQRKELMDASSDAFLILPGGIGTLEELVEIMTLRQLGYHDREIVLLDERGFWDHLVAQLRRMVSEGFAARELLDVWTVVEDIPSALSAIRQHVPTARPRRLPTELGADATGALEVVEAPPGSDNGPPGG